MGVRNSQASGLIGAILVAAVVVMYLLVSPSRTDVPASLTTVRGSPTAAAPTVSACSPANVDAMIHAFVDAFNGGRVDDLLSGAFVWYSFNASDVSEVAYGRDPALRLLHERQSAGDHIQIQNTQVGTDRSWDGAWGFGYAATVTRNGQRYDAHGKGELYCDGSYPGLSLWSMGAP